MEKKSFSTSIKCSKYRDFVKSLIDAQKVVVRSCGFGSLLHFDCSEAPRSITYLLARRFDVPTRRVNMENGSSFELNPFVTHPILGVPLGGWKVRYYASNAGKEIIGNDTGTSTVAPTVDQLFSLVSPELTGDKFGCLFMLISLAIFLCPTNYPRASKHYYSAVASVDDIHKYNWSSFILDWLVEGIDDFQKSVAANKKMSTLCGCIIVLVVAYFEYIKAPGIILREDWPRIKIWDDRMVHEYLELEGNSGDDTLFGHLELKEPKEPSETPFVAASVSSSSFARLPAQVESFIENLAPHNDQSNVRSQIRDMCSNLHRDIMAASLAAIQPVVSRQLCCMAEYMWNSSQKHGGAGTSGAAGPSGAAATSVRMESHGAAGTPDQTDRHVHGQVHEGVTTCRRSKGMHRVEDAVMSGANRKGQMHTESHGAVGTPVQMDRQVHTEVDEGMATRSTSKGMYIVKTTDGEQT